MPQPPACPPRSPSARSWMSTAVSYWWPTPRGWKPRSVSAQQLKVASTTPAFMPPASLPISAPASSPRACSISRPRPLSPPKASPPAPLPGSRSSWRKAPGPSACTPAGPPFPAPPPPAWPSTVSRLPPALMRASSASSTPTSSARRRPSTWGNFAPRELTDRSNRLSYLYGVMINRRGHRFVDEGEDGAMFTYAKYGRAILAEPGAKAYQIFDSQVVHLLEPRYATSEPITADTLEDLVAQLDIGAKAQAIRALHEYSAAAKHANDGFDPPKK